MRPRIVCHMMSSVDGKLHPSRYSRPLDVEKAVLHGHYDRTAATFGAQGWIVGRVTMAEVVKDERPASIGTGTSGPREAWFAPGRGASFAVAIDPDGKLHYPMPTVGQDSIVTVLGTHVRDTYLAELRESGVSYVFAGSDGRDLAEGLQALSQGLGVTTLLLEGGAAINAAFLHAGLIDEISVLVFPGLDAVAGVQSIFEGPETGVPGYGRPLALKAVETLEGGMVWLRYEVSNA